jgi:hypothetical protein
MKIMPAAVHIQQRVHVIASRLPEQPRHLHEPVCGRSFPTQTRSMAPIV